MSDLKKKETKTKPELTKQLTSPLIDSLEKIGNDVAEAIKTEGMKTVVDDKKIEGIVEGIVGLV